MTRDQFKKQLKELQSVLFNICVYHAVWLELWPTEDKVGILNRHIGFFGPVRQALWEMMHIHSAKMFDRNPKANSLWRLIDASREDPSLIPHAAEEDLNSLSDQLSQHEDSVLKALTRLRNQRLAHLQATSSQPMPITIGEFKGLIAGLKSVFNGLSRAHDRSLYDWSYQVKRSTWETTEILRVLNEEKERVAREADELLRRVQDEAIQDNH